MLGEHLDEDYFGQVEHQLKVLKFKGGMLMSAGLTAGNKGNGYTLRQAREQGLLERFFDRSGYSFTVPDRDDGGFRALGELEDKGINQLANALTQAVDHVHSFFVMLRVEIGFCVACLNLSDRLGELGEPTTFPTPVGRGELSLSGQELYDVSLALTTAERVVGNDVAADHKSLVMISGANQGGKSTFLRSVGLAQLMMQCGMFVGAQSFRVNVCDGVFTHYKREEDEAMDSGKLDEELARMSLIVDHVTPNCLLLCNESFAATNEREGSQIARQVVSALIESGIKVLFVTHMFDLTDGFYSQHLDTALFLRAERGAEGARPFKLAEGKPLPTSYGEDSYRGIFGRSIDAVAAAVPDARRS
jgi:DNA mismatch repair ATPase MutS